MPSHQRTTRGPGSGRVPRSPTGRIPKWALDEAMGRPVQPTPWRATEPVQLYPSSGRTGSRRERLWGVLAIVIAAAVVLALGLSSGWPQHPGAAPRASGPPPGHEEGAATHPSAVMKAGAGEYRFSFRQSDGSPVTFSPCRPIHYVVRPDHAPANGDRMIAAAVAEVSRATGLRFVADGRTDEPIVQDRRPYQPDRYGKRWAPVLIAWVTEEEDPDFGVDIAGNAGAQRVSRPGGQFTYVTGAVHLDPGVLTDLTRTRGEAVARSVLLHELGHLVGLAHVKDATQIMFPRAQPGVVSFGAGDLKGLAALGSGSCVPDL
jgi:Matrixin